MLVTGSSGLIGSALVAALEADGHRVVRLVRSRPEPGQVQWDPANGELDAASIEGYDAVVHLAGAGIGDHRWTDAHKAAVLDSRVRGTTLLAERLASLEAKPAVFISGSAVGYYGLRGYEELTEDSGTGTGFLADVVRQWEEAAAPAAEAGIRVAMLRSGVVLSAKGGALKKQLLPFQLGIAGRLGTGRQWLSWISIDDHVAAMRHVLATEALSGPVNVTAPNPVTNADFTKALGKVLRRPTVVPVPTAALDLLFGKEMVSEMLTGGQRVIPAALEASGFEFAHPEIEGALRHLLGR